MEDLLHKSMHQVEKEKHKMTLDQSKKIQINSKEQIQSSMFLKNHQIEDTDVQLIKASIKDNFILSRMPEHIM